MDGRREGGEGAKPILPRAHVGDTEPRQSRATALLLFYPLLLFQLSLLFRPRPDIPRNRFPEKWKASRSPPGMARYEIVRRCSHRRKTSVGYWGRDYSTNVCIHVRTHATHTYVHTRACIAAPRSCVLYRDVLVDFRSMKV